MQTKLIRFPPPARPEMSYRIMGCLHDPANVYFEYICWKFAGHLLDRVNTLLLHTAALPCRGERAMEVMGTLQIFFADK